MIILPLMSRWLRISFATSGASLARQWPVGRLPLSSLSSSSSTADDGNDNDGRSQPRHQEPARRRTRRRTLSLNEDTVPSLADFIHRAKIHKQYRNFIRLAHFIDGKDSITGGSNKTDDNNARGCRAALDEVRISYKMGMKIGVDAMAKNMSYVEGERRLRELEQTVGYYPTREQHRLQSPTSKESSYDADSWINIQDEDDPRGRVGVQWPWELSKDDDEVK
ncbi:hypothetical protein ACHAXH_007103 [Discostella pseudostelligera]|jgi:hypothetical protein